MDSSISQLLRIILISSSFYRYSSNCEAGTARLFLLDLDAVVWQKFLTLNSASSYAILVRQILQLGHQICLLRVRSPVKCLLSFDDGGVWYDMKPKGYLSLGWRMGDSAFFFYSPLTSDFCSFSILFSFLIYSYKTSSTLSWQGANLRSNQQFNFFQSSNSSCSNFLPSSKAILEFLPFLPRNSSFYFYSRDIVDRSLTKISCTRLTYSLIQANLAQYSLRMLGWEPTCDWLRLQAYFFRQLKFISLRNSIYLVLFSISCCKMEFSIENCFSRSYREFIQASYYSLELKPRPRWHLEVLLIRNLLKASVKGDAVRTMTLRCARSGLGDLAGVLSIFLERIRLIVWRLQYLQNLFGLNKFRKNCHIIESIKIILAVLQRCLEQKYTLVLVFSELGLAMILAIFFDPPQSSCFYCLQLVGRIVLEFLIWIFSKIFDGFLEFFFISNEPSH